MQKNIYKFSAVLVVTSVVVWAWLSLPNTKPAPPTGKNPAPSLSKSADSKVSSSPTPGSNGSSTDKTKTTSYSKPAIIQNSTGGTAVVSDGGQTYPIRRYKTLAVNDPYGNQWWTTQTGLDTAWIKGAGPRQTTVAVIDTGFALKHEEFSGRWAVNSGEQGPATSEAPSQLNCTARGLPLDKSCNLIDDNHDGIVDNESGPTTKENPSRLNCTDRGLPLDKSCNLIDDDGNGYVDDVTGWDFANYDNNVQAGEINPSGTSTTHATEVTGVLAATGNNGKGIAGVNWSTKILPLQAIDDDGYGDTLTVSGAIRYAADRSVDVISLSLGTSAEDPYLRQAVQYALSKGSIVVAASGNDGCNCMSYPASYPEVLAVGSDNANGTPSSFSSYGNSLDILAPGENITSATWSSSNPTSAYVSGINGTSFATPYVSGLLSLARSYQPNATWAELVSSLTSQANHAGLTAAAPFSVNLGYGYAQADALINRVSAAKTPAMRYNFGPLTASGPMGSERAYQCEAGDFPTTPMYELSQGSSLRYSVDILEQLRAAGSGWTVKQVWYGCLGLPTDAPASLRTINLLSEVGNAAY